MTAVELQIFLAAKGISKSGKKAEPTGVRVTYFTKGIATVKKGRKKTLPQLEVNVGPDDTPIGKKKEVDNEWEKGT